MKRRGLLATGLACAMAAAWPVAQAGSYDEFFRAIEVDNVSGLRSLLERGFDPNSRDERGQVGLYLALRSPSPKAAELLLAQPQIDIDAVNAAGETPLMIAALKGNAAMARKLVDRGAPVARDGWSPLHYAASGPDPDIAAMLLAKGAPIDAPSPNGTTPLMMAARYGNEATVDLLLARGADPKRRNAQGLSAGDFAHLDGRDRLGKRLDGLAQSAR